MLTLAVALLLQVCPQQIRVAAPSASSTIASVSLYECGRRVTGPWRARVGYNGLSAHHREGDGTTPTGTYRLGPVVYGLDPDPGLAFRYHRLACGDWWDEDSGSATYNSFRHVRCGAGPPFGGDSEALWRVTVAYRLFAFIEYNVATYPFAGERGEAHGCVFQRRKMHGVATNIY